ncbi:hypothetical protein ABTK08_21510, partial [Acinetobacter baumannii]
MPAGWRAPPGLAADPLPALDLPAPRRPARGATEADAWATLSDFLGGRGQAYRSGLSSPLTAETSCSRLSEHLA